MRPSLEQAITAIRAGDKKTGRALLADIIQADWDNEMAWLWLSSVVETDDERRRCLKRVLEINPDNQAAQRGLALLGPDPSPQIVSSPPEPDEEPPPVEDEGEELLSAPSPVSLAERLALASREPADLDTELLGRVETQPADEIKSDPTADEVVPPAAHPEVELEAESGEPASAMVDGVDDSAAGYLAAEEGEFATEDRAGQPDDQIDRDMGDGGEVETETAPEPSFWRTGRGTLALAGLVVLLLACVACAVIILVFNSYVSQSTALPETLAESPIPAGTSTPSEIPPAVAAPTNTPSPTLTASPTSTTVVADTPTPTPTMVRTATPIRNADVVQVISVIAADEIEVDSNGEPVRVKYLSIAVPAFNDAQRGTEPFGLEALALNQSLVQGQTVQLERDRLNTDDEGRLLRYVYVDNLQVNEELVRQGLARVELVPPNTKYGARLQEAEQDARMNRRGLWSLE
jgi:micrococcal nuclease